MPWWPESVTVTVTLLSAVLSIVPAEVPTPLTKAEKVPATGAPPTLLKLLVRIGVPT